MREVVIPGEKLSDGTKLHAGQGTYKADGGVYADTYGLLNKREDAVSVVPLEGKYMPREGDKVIGVIEAIRFEAAFVDIRSAYNGYLSLDRGDRLKAGDVVLVDIASVNEVNKVDLERPMKLYEGKLLDIPPVKIPRIVGHKGSMLALLRQDGVTLFVGRNGRVYIKGDPALVKKTEKALSMIVELAHTDGLTDKIKDFLEGESNGNEK